ncbi:MAG TPA: hypothetical protein VKV73_00185 [Chloroflexota bacterium]|nr:hypothetical protein [Chloroflexota bacterium]
MLSPLALELFAQDVRREHRAAMAHAALLAQLPHRSASRPDLVARLRLASGLRALASYLDPCGDLSPSVVALHSR